MLVAKRFWVALMFTVSACTTPGEFSMELNTSTNVAKTSDTVSFYVSHADGDITFTISPNTGLIASNNIYIAPATILNDSTWVTLYAQTATQTASRKILLVKAQATDTVISFAKTIQPLLVANCNFSGCHGNGSSAGRVELSQYDSVVKFVVPYQPGKSLLYASLIKTDPLRRMPPAGPLHPYKINWVSKWIEQGANNN